MTERMKRLEEAYKICMEKGNTFMAGNIKKAMEHERRNAEAN